MDAMEMDLDVDMGAELVPDQPIAFQAQDTPSPGEVVDAETLEQPDTHTLVPNKLHIAGGLDNLNDKEVREYIKEHTDVTFERLEWIDDGHLNAVYSSPSEAQEAMVALAAIEIGDVTQLPAFELLPAKPFSQKSGVALQIRVAVVADKKQPRAAEKSRFYLLNPEWDRENRVKRYRDRDGERGGRRRGRREDEPIDKFDVNLYDDSAAALATEGDDSRPRRRRSYTPDHDNDDRRRSYRSSNRNKELFPGGGSGRDRSASPTRDRDGDHGMDETRPTDGSAERNRRGARAIKDRLTRSNQAKELFPGSGPSSESNRLNDADELSNRFALPLYDGSHDEPPVPRSRRLGDRIAAPGGSGRLADRLPDPADSTGFSIRGSAAQRSADQGFAIKGGAKTARELFPDKLGGGNAGKELFADKAEGRSRRRQKAGDLFD
ncbi:hypothetical protein BKA67DRAFT_533899 [Truncatella angustata]|uniref:Uncharacterized protein n=1 Tax=Truncatella angustata TaxID=152316 RepID=A0A9P8UMU0_9PEZI|nr:uncharacterized protein BKA67DRAFT_533899 [Truncatella angustata]KAH6654950.1 hypothetical protein BKA67DRAFT_533899 [Truncatella angustata]KAH8204046.1 hypothetical protein TruAng_001728 [Truncatella angustata]